MPKTRTLLILGALAAGAVLWTRRSKGTGLSSGGFTTPEIPIKQIAAARLPMRMQSLMSSYPTPVNAQAVMAGYFPSRRR